MRMLLQNLQAFPMPGPFTFTPISGPILVPQPPVMLPIEPSGGTFVDGIYTGTSEVDTLVGGEDATTFYLGMGIGDSVVGNSDDDTLLVDGGVEEWTFTENQDGSVSMSHAAWGVNTITGIEQITFARTGETYTVEDAIAATDGLPDFRVDADNVTNGTPFDDIMNGTAADDYFYGGVGDDTYDGAGGYNQVNYDGVMSDYTITQNEDGSFTFVHDVWGTDTVSNVDGFYFAGNFEWVGADDLVLDNDNSGSRVAQDSDSASLTSDFTDFSSDAATPATTDTVVDGIEPEDAFVDFDMIEDGVV